VVSFERRSDDDTELVTLNLSNTPFHGSVEAETPVGQRWVETSLPQSGYHHARGNREPPPVALPALSLDAFQARIFRLAPGAAWTVTCLRKRRARRFNFANQP
jgi:hypothetical protein